MLPLRSKRALEPVLPPPALSNSRRPPSGKKTTTFDSHGFPTTVRVHWSKFKQRISPGTLTESLIEISESQNGSEGVFRKQTVGATDDGGAQGELQEDDEVDETVVDNSFWQEGGDHRTKSLTQPSEMGISPDKSGASNTHGTHLTDAESLHEKTGLALLWDQMEGFGIRFARTMDRFFFTSFYDPVAEAQYRKETYYQGKGLAFWGSLFVVLNWVLLCALLNRESTIFWDKMFYWVVCPVFCVPLVPMIIFDIPRRYPVFYQIWVTWTLWSWAGYSLLMLNLCGVYTPDQAKVNCRGKEFVGIFYYTTAFPVIGLFALGQNRFMISFSSLFTMAFFATIIRAKQSWIRNTLNFGCFIIFLIWIHYQKESAERRLYNMRDRLKVQYRATQQAQVSESKAADSKKRFSSYIFHEVRVPLNTALLAVQNMEASGVFREDDIEFTALEGSLTMMSKVLNDVLDFNRMDAGRFESVSKPYSFHTVMRSMLVPLQLASHARDLHLITDLDPQIDIFARTALYLAQGHDANWIRERLKTDDDGAALVAGDQHRLRQIVTNLTSNACKFTPTGGKIWVRTKLILPPELESEGPNGDPGLFSLLDATSAAAPLSGISAGLLMLHNAPPGVRPAILDRMVIRIEVEDTGVGIRRKDMIDNRLFSPYVQTDIGKFQGGKGTGLGLALSKHIIRLSGGRLGVKSKRNMGSTFWVELSMGVGAKVLEKQEFHGKENMVAQTFGINRAFRAPEGEGETPTTIPSSENESPHDSFGSHRPNQTASAMRQLMEHSGQIELVPRNTGASFVNHHAASVLTLSRTQEGEPEPAPELDEGSVSTPGTVRPAPPPGRVELPPPQFSFGSSTATSGGSEVKTPFTPPASAETPQPPTVSKPQLSHLSPTSPPSPMSPIFDPPLSVLVVDDDALTRKLMSRMLTRIGCTVEMAENGKAALDMTVGAKNPFTFQPSSDDRPRRVRTPYLREEEPKYDVIFLDNQMPVMSGVEMVRRLRELKRKDFVVGVTGNALKEDQEEYIDAGVDAVLTKPVREANLREFLHLADGKRREKIRLANEELSSDENSPRPP